MRRGLDQLTAWILAVVVAGAVFAGGYFASRLMAAHSDDYDGAESAAGHGESTHGDTEHAQSEHGEPAHGEPAHAAPAHGEPAHAAPAHGEPAHAAPAHGESKDDASHAPPAAHGTASDHSQPAHAAVTKAAAKAPIASVAWGYKGSAGPEHWGDLSPVYKTCGTGRRQSPVDIDETAINGKLLPIRFHYKLEDAVLNNTGRTITAAYPTGNYIEVDGERFDLKHIEFHAPSEHKVAGIPYDLEAQLVHANVDGQLAIVGVLFEEGEESRALKPLWQAVPREVGPAPEPLEYNPETLLPQRRLYYSYTGSLTSPPCTEGAKWFVLTQPVGVSSKQVDEFASIVAFNARPVQPLNGRRVAKSSR